MTLRWTIDPAHTEVTFSAKHLGVATVRGRFTRFEGEIDLDDDANPTTASGRVEIDAASIDTANADRDAHLRSADFLDVERYPTLVVELRSVQAKGDDSFAVVCDVTIKDQTHPATFEYEHGGTVTDPYGNTKAGGTLVGTIERSTWGLTWNVPLDGGGWLVSEKIRIEVDGEIARSVEEVRKSAAAETTESGGSGM
jgi:polyisoprenoid-binding protein YceI